MSSFNFNSVEIFNEIHVKIYAIPENKSLTVGVELAMGDSYINETEMDKILALGISLNGVRINFEKFDSSTLIIPQRNNYNLLENIDSISVGTKLTLSLEDKSGQYNLTSLLNELLQDANPFTKTLAPLLRLEENMGDTLYIDVQTTIGLNDILGDLQVQLDIYTLDRDFELVITYIKGDLYIDAENIGLEKLVIHDIQDVIAMFSSGENAPENSYSRNIYENYMYYENLFNESPSEFSLSEQMERVTAMAKIALHENKGLTITVVSGMIKALCNMLEIDIEKYISGIAEPNVKLNVDNNVKIGLEINIESSEYDSENLIYLNALLEETNNDKVLAFQEWKEDVSNAESIRIEQYHKAEAWKSFYDDANEEEKADMDKSLNRVIRIYPDFSESKRLSYAWEDYFDKKQSANVTFMNTLCNDDNIEAKMLAWDEMRNNASQLQNDAMDIVFETLTLETKYNEAWQLLYVSPQLGSSEKAMMERILASVLLEHEFRDIVRNRAEAWEKLKTELEMNISVPSQKAALELMNDILENKIKGNLFTEKDKKALGWSRLMEEYSSSFDNLNFIEAKLANENSELRGIAWESLKNYENQRKSEFNQELGTVSPATGLYLDLENKQAEINATVDEQILLQLYAEKATITSRINTIIVEIQNININLDEMLEKENEQLGTENEIRAKAWDEWLLYSITVDRVDLMKGILKADAWDYMYQLYTALNAIDGIDYSVEISDMDNQWNLLSENTYSYDYQKKEEAWNNLKVYNHNTSIGGMLLLLEQNDIYINAFDVLYAEASEKNLNLANISLGLNILGDSLEVSVDREIKYEDINGNLVSTIPELLDEEDKQEYKRYDELKIYMELNLSLENALEEGELGINEILALFPAVNGIESAIKFTDEHSLLAEMSGKIGIDFSKLLSDNSDDIDEAIYGNISLTYYIMDYENEGSSEEFQQVILNVWIMGKDIYLQADLLDSNLNLHVPNMYLARALLNIVGLSDEEINLNPLSNAVYKSIPGYIENLEQNGEELQNPFQALYGAANADETIVRSLLEALIRVNSQ